MYVCHDAFMHRFHITNPLHIMWIKGHANFIGNEICDHFSKWAAHSLIFTPDLLPPPPLSSVAVHHLPAHLPAAFP